VERKVNAPDKETLDETESAVWLGITEGVFKAMLRRGVLPPGIPFGPRTLRWHWLDLVSVLHLLSRGGFQAPAGEEAGE
jgi:hypothetical protein